jgi:hypothetical protein
MNITSRAQIKRRLFGFIQAALERAAKMDKPTQEDILRQVDIYKNSLCDGMDAHGPAPLLVIALAFMDCLDTLNCQIREEMERNESFAPTNTTEVTK